MRPADAAVDRTVNLSSTADIDSVVNGDSATTATRFVLAAGATYRASTTVVPRDGDEIVGPTGTFTQRGPAYDPSTNATITGGGTIDQVIKPQGTVSLEWLKVTGANFDGTAGSGSGIALGASTPQTRVYAVEVIDTDGAGITGANGVLNRIELARNTNDPNALGFIGSGVKGVDEYVIRNSYVHDQQGNGIWCDEECDDTTVSVGTPTGTVSGKFYVADNLVVNNAKQGIRYELVPTVDPGGEALIRGNRVHGNNVSSNTGGVGVRDASHAVIEDNVFGAATVAGISYPNNGTNVAVWVTESGTRYPTTDITVRNNTLNGEVVECLSGSNLTCQ